MQLKWPMLWNFFSLFPAYAGVILFLPSGMALIETLPRIRGGDPNLAKCKRWKDASSPHTRG